MAGAKSVESEILSFVICFFPRACYSVYTVCIQESKIPWWLMIKPMLYSRQPIKYTNLRYISAQTDIESFLKSVKIVTVQDESALILILPCCIFSTCMSVCVFLWLLKKLFLLGLLGENICLLLFSSLVIECRIASFIE